MSKTYGPQSINLGGGGISDFDIGRCLLQVSKHLIGKNPRQRSAVLSECVLGDLRERGMSFGVKQTFVKVCKSQLLSQSQFPCL